jgi:hypothetical protein
VPPTGKAVHAVNHLIRELVNSLIGQVVETVKIVEIVNSAHGS